MLSDRIDAMTLEEKIGQMMMFGFKGKQPDSSVEALIKTKKLGNLIYFKRNIASPQQIHALNKHYQNLSEIPMLIGIDQEGGFIKAIEGIVDIPGAMAASAANDSSAYEIICEHSGKALKALGINMNFAPVADINSNPENPVINTRSYGDEPDQVSKFVSAAIKGYRRAGILSTAKHFPGHGDTSVDSHLGLPVLSFTQRRLEAFELVPFVHAMKTGVPAIMPAHILLEHLDSYPSTLSQKVLKRLLREDLGFKGLLITDLLSMHAIKDRFTLEETILRAVDAGNDILLYDAPTYDECLGFMHVFISLVQKGDISIDRIDQSVQRILRYKELYNVGSMPESFEESYALLNPEEAKALSNHITRQSLTLIRKNHQLPLDYSKTLIVFPTLRHHVLIDNYEDNKHTFGSYLKSLDISANEVLLDEGFNQGQLDALVKISKPYQTIVLFTQNMTDSEMQTKALERLSSDKTVHISLRSPYDGLSRDTGTYLCAYDATPSVYEAIHEWLQGTLRPEGKLPIKSS